MSVQVEKSNLINLLNEISDLSLIKRVKAFLVHELERGELTESQKKELDIRLEEHRKNPKSGVDAFKFLDEMEKKYGV